MVAATHGQLKTVQWLLFNGYETVSQQLWECLGSDCHIDHMYEPVLDNKDAHWLADSVTSRPTVLTRMMLLAQFQHPLPQPVCITFVIQDLRSYDYASALSGRLPAWKTSKNDIVLQSLAAHLHSPLIIIVLDFSSPSVEEIWSVELGIVDQGLCTKIKVSQISSFSDTRKRRLHEV